MSDWPAAERSPEPDFAHGLAPPPEEPAAREAWFAVRLALLLDVNADRALSPVARHTLVELLLDGVEDAIFPAPEEDAGTEVEMPVSTRLAIRLGITPRAARKALAELEALGLLERRGPGKAQGRVLVLPGAIADHLRRGTDAPLGRDEAAADPAAAHAARLERLRNLALGDGLITTALAAERALGRSLGFQAPPRPANDDDILSRPPAERRGIHFHRVVNFLRDFFVGDPAFHDDLLAWIAAVRAASGGAANAGAAARTTALAEGEGSPA